MIRRVVEQGMSDLPRMARRLGSYVLFGGGTVGLIGGSLVGLLAIEGMVARRLIGDADDLPPDADGLYGGGFGEPDRDNRDSGRTPLSFVVLGDSTACGYGVASAAETPGALLADGLAQLADRPVRLRVVARVGAETYQLDDQVRTLLPDPADPSEPAEPDSPDVALIIIGANDVIHRTSPAMSVRPLITAIEQLRSAGTEVVVGTCPDLGTIGPLAPPLRQVARVWSRHLAAVQTVAALDAGARTVALGALLGPEFTAAPTELFGPDHFHPSATGYASAAAAVLPSLAAAVNAWPEDESGVPLGEGPILPITFAQPAR